MSAPIQKPRCFVISPIGPDGSDIRRNADMALEYIIRPALPDFEVFRADEIGAPDLINDRVIEAILNAELCIADLTGQNANVFYELGLRHMVEKPVIPIAEAATKVPFDNAGVATIFYGHEVGSHKAARERIASAAKMVLAPGYVVSTPVTAARGRMKLANSADPRDEVIAQLMSEMSELKQAFEQQRSGMREAFSGPGTTRLRDERSDTFTRQLNVEVTPEMASKLAHLAKTVGAAVGQRMLATAARTSLPTNDQKTPVTKKKKKPSPASE